jgi:MFS family permease
MEGFRDSRAGWEFWLSSVATFLCFTTMQQQALFAVVMKHRGMPLNDIGIVLAASGGAVLVISLVAGPIAARLGNLTTLRLSLAVMFVAYASFHWTIGSFPAAMVSRVIQGAGYGLFMPSALAFIRGKLTLGRLIYLVGIFSSMVSLPNAVGPPLGEAYLRAFGDAWFFPVTSLPLGLAVLLSIGLTEERANGTAARLPLLQTALLPSLRRPFIAILVVGAIYGLILSYMASLLAEKDVPIAFFYTSFTIVLFGSRFVLMSRLSGASRMGLVAAGIGAMALSYVMVALFASPIPIAIAGILFGLGYSIAFPTVSVIVTEQFEPQQRATPLAIFNAMFSLGILLTPWFGTYLIGALGYNGLLYALAAVGLGAIVYLRVTPKSQRQFIAET